MDYNSAREHTSRMHRAFAGIFFTLALSTLSTFTAWSAECQNISIGNPPLGEFSNEATHSYVAKNGNMRTLRGGLYGGNHNSPSPSLRANALSAAKRIMPLNAEGTPDTTNGKIVLLTAGMSNAKIESQAFQNAVAADSTVNRQIVVVNGAKGGKDAAEWIDRSYPHTDNTYESVHKRLELANVTPAQVQVIWMKHSLKTPSNYPNHINWLGRYLDEIYAVMKKEFPNLRLVYVSSRIYAGYATNALNPEPFAYESAFAVRDFILGQHTKDWHKYRPRFDPSEPHDPVALWGPYIWADGLNPRSDGLIWACNDFRNDGTHPSDIGSQKVADMLLKFFKTDETARLWFLTDP